MKQVWLVLCALIVVTGCSKQSTERVITGVPTPAGDDSALPNLSVGADGNVYLSWVETRGEEHALLFSVWDGETWGTSREIASGPGWFVNWADFPSMNALADGTLAAHWLAKVGEGTYAYGVYVSLSHDHGASWSAPILMHDDNTETEHGFVSLFPLDADHFGVAWLDGREMAGTEHGAEHGEGTAGAMNLRFATLSRDGAIANDVVLDHKVCDCCQTGWAMAADGTALVAYRDRSDTEVRDISWVERAPGGAWSEPRLVHADNWEINGCPVNGPQLASSGGVTAAAWFTVENEASVVRAAFQDPKTGEFGTPVRVDDGSPEGRVDVVLLDGKALVTWIESANGITEVHMRTIAPNGVRGPTLIVAATTPERSSGFPRMVEHQGSVYLAWTEVGEQDQVRVAVYE